MTVWHSRVGHEEGTRPSSTAPKIRVAGYDVSSSTCYRQNESLSVTFGQVSNLFIATTSAATILPANTGFAPDLHTSDGTTLPWPAVLVLAARSPYVTSRFAPRVTWLPFAIGFLLDEVRFL
jgi:hypothetical protein